MKTLFSMSGLPGGRFDGKAAIAKFYAGRRAQGRRTTLHIVNNFILIDWSADSARPHARDRVAHRG
ncbi:hypothetical protein A5625_11075 [Mycobacterium sp. 1465703.0]|nr:hypothetical protein A5625_11075 [Mycobacterium sp. 1465703.0]